MANWAYVCYKCIGEHEELQELYDIIKSCESDNKYCDIWWGDVIDKIINNRSETMYVRGSINEYELEDSCLTIYQECAWGELPQVRECLENNFPIDIYYYVEEPGCEVFVTNDVDKEFFPQEWYIDMSDRGIEYFDSDEEMIDFINREYDKDFHTVEEVQHFSEEIYENNDDEYLYIHHIEYDYD